MLMPNTFFKFKQFTVFQDHCAMKVGTDGVLLGAWTNVNECDRLLDIGTGTGLIALMLAQKNCDAHIDAIEIDENCVLQAKQNVSRSRFEYQIDIQKISFQDYLNVAERKYDLIVSNPPYFQNALKSTDIYRNFARHDTTLSFTEIISESGSLLKERGRISLILPFDFKRKVIEDAINSNLFPCRITNVFPLPHKPAKRLLIELVKDEATTTCIENNLVIESSRHQYSGEFKSLTCDFYLDK